MAYWLKEGYRNRRKVRLPWFQGMEYPLTSYLLPSWISSYDTEGTWIYSTNHNYQFGVREHVESSLAAGAVASIQRQLSKHSMSSQGLNTLLLFHAPFTAVDAYIAFKQDIWGKGLHSLRFIILADGVHLQYEKPLATWNDIQTFGYHHLEWLNGFLYIRGKQVDLLDDYAKFPYKLLVFTSECGIIEVDMSALDIAIIQGAFEDSYEFIEFKNASATQSKIVSVFEWGN